jgi:hypothetical protein
MNTELAPSLIGFLNQSYFPFFLIGGDWRSISIDQIALLVSEYHHSISLDYFSIV